MTGLHQCDSQHHSAQPSTGHLAISTALQSGTVLSWATTAAAAAAASLALHCLRHTHCRHAPLALAPRLDLSPRTFPLAATTHSQRRERAPHAACSTCISSTDLVSDAACPACSMHTQAATHHNAYQCPANACSYRQAPTTSLLSTCYPTLLAGHHVTCLLALCLRPGCFDLPIKLSSRATDLAVTFNLAAREGGGLSDRLQRPPLNIPSPAAAYHTVYHRAELRHQAILGNQALLEHRTCTHP
jgi:hypothetical protein